MLCDIFPHTWKSIVGIEIYLGKHWCAESIGEYYCMQYALVIVKKNPQNRKLHN